MSDSRLAELRELRSQLQRRLDEVNAEISRLESSQRSSSPSGATRNKRKVKPLVFGQLAFNFGTGIPPDYASNGPPLVFRPQNANPLNKVALVYSEANYPFSDASLEVMRSHGLDPFPYAVFTSPVPNLEDYSTVLLLTGGGSRFELEQYLQLARIGVLRGARANADIRILATNILMIRQKRSYTDPRLIVIDITDVDPERDLVNEILKLKSDLDSAPQRQVALVYHRDHHPLNGYDRETLRQNGIMPVSYSTGSPPPDLSSFHSIITLVRADRLNSKSITPDAYISSVRGALLNGDEIKPISVIVVSSAPLDIDSLGPRTKAHAVVPVMLSVGPHGEWIYSKAVQKAIEMK